MSRATHIVSVSGGKDSTALYLLALERMQAKGRPFRAVFADTGNEHEAVYDAVRNLPLITGGPEIEWVRGDFSARIANKRNVVDTKWRREGVSEEIINAALEMLHPTGNPFLDLCIWKGRFPSTKVRFCTEELKVNPTQQQIYAPIIAKGQTVISWQGVRADESLARSLLPRWQRLVQAGRVYAYRPLLTWKVDDVWAMHAKHGVPRNRLYEQGMSRVGCMPCIMAKKDELREIARRFPDHIDRIAKWEAIVSAASKLGSTTFMSAEAGDEVDYKTHGIRERIEWSKTSRGGKQYDLIRAEFGTACDQWGGLRMSCIAGEACIRATNAEARVKALEKALKECRPFVAHFKGGWSQHTPGHISTDDLLETIDAALNKGEGWASGTAI